METEAGGEENARGNTGDAAATGKRVGADVPAGEEAARAADDAAATEEAAGGDDPAGAEAAKAAAAAAGEGSGDRTDGPEAAGAPGADVYTRFYSCRLCWAPKRRGL